MSENSLSGKRLVITGASRGIGAAIARQAVSRGANVALVGLESERLRALSDELAPSACWFEADVRDGASLRAAIDQAAEAMGGIDVVIANAGVVEYGTVRQTSYESFERVIDININGVFRTLRDSTPHLRRSKGNAVVIASAASFAVLPGTASYGASKAGAEMLGLTYRQEVAHLGITVGVAHLTFVNTDLLHSADSAMPSFAEMRQKLPYPAKLVVDVDVAAASLIDGIVHRSTRIYVPGALLWGNWLRPVLASPLAWPLAKRLASKFVPLIERDVAMLAQDGAPARGPRNAPTEARGA